MKYENMQRIMKLVEKMTENHLGGLESASAYMYRQGMFDGMQAILEQFEDQESFDTLIEDIENECKIN